MTDKEIREAIGDPALYEGLAEEAVELAHAALKFARILRGENPTPADRWETKWSLIDEYSDLRIYSDILDLRIDAQVYSDKKERMVARIREAG